jgi:hypothetical protein
MGEVASRAGQRIHSLRLPVFFAIGYWCSIFSYPCSPARLLQPRPHACTHYMHDFVSSTIVAALTYNTHTHTDPPAWLAHVNRLTPWVSPYMCRCPILHPASQHDRMANCLVHMLLRYPPDLDLCAMPRQSPCPSPNTGRHHSIPGFSAKPTPKLASVFWNGWSTC